MRISLPHYTAQDYQRDIDRDTLALQSEPDPKVRAQLQTRIRTAQAYIADPTPQFKW